MGVLVELAFVVERRGEEEGEGREREVGTVEKRGREV